MDSLGKHDIWTKEPTHFTYFLSARNKVRTVILVKKSIHTYIDQNFSSDDLIVVAVKNGKDETRW